jgi:4-hydroxybenzoate polyprenyltransferase
MRYFIIDGASVETIQKIIHKNPFRQHKISLILPKFFLLCDKLVSFLISTSLFLALSGSFKVLSSDLLINTFSTNTAILTFLITFSIYGLNKLTDLKEDAINIPERINIIGRIRPVFKFSLVSSFILSVILSFLINAHTLPVLLFPLFSGILYSVKFSKNLPRLKDITGVKNITIALTWAVYTTFLPVVYFNDFYRNQTISMFYLFFFKSYINSVLFDFRDIEGDSMNGVRTIPVALGRSKTKKFLLILNSAFIPWLVFSLYTGIFHRYLFALVFSIVYGYWYILHFCREGKKVGKSLDLLVDGEWILTVIFALIFALR